MSAVSETIVREYFELHEFLVRQHRKYIGQTRREETTTLISSCSTRIRRRAQAALPFVLGSRGLAVHRARHCGRQRLAHGDLQLRAC